MTLFTKPRKEFIHWIRRQLIGPLELEEELKALPTERFPCGILCPISPSFDDIDGNVEQNNLQNEDTQTAEPMFVRRFIPPSSLGFSFFILGENIQFQVLCSAVSYNQNLKKSWERQTLVSGHGNEEEFENITCPQKNGRQTFFKLGNKARIDIQWRQFSDGWIVTVSLANTQELNDSTNNYTIERAKRTLYEARLRCQIDNGQLGVYPRVDLSLLDEEEQEIEFQYADRHIYAIGHGCAVDWTKNKDGEIVEIYSETMPSVEVPQMTADTETGEQSVLSLARLVTIDTIQSALAPSLEQFIGGYSDWISKQKKTLLTLTSEDQIIANRIIKRMENAVSRMRQGLELLCKDVHARKAFSIANESMLAQMQQHDKVKGIIKDVTTYKWRPFQLAFLLMVLESSANENSDFRDAVDLIWFPTGGGKTEAYLGLIAFQIALRRMRYPNTGGGTAILMRYTLRLLTRDQFIRATRLICALELIRRQRDDLSCDPITIGMWVGGSTSPNTFAEANKLFKEAIAQKRTPDLILKGCPWCGQTFEARNYDSTDQKFNFLCSNTQCEFGSSTSQELPCNIVDEALYEAPPTMLVATIDKFARLAWEERATAFFGSHKCKAPELIIQDELHLISGALGSVAGLYEASIDTVLQLRGMYPKYIASTATIRMAKQQVKRLYGRDLAVFPPPGLSCDDSYFARTVPLAERPGRMYVGYLAPMLNTQECLAPLAAALLLAPHKLFDSVADRNELLDAWWTQVVYHGSLKGVGNSHTAFTRDVLDFMNLLLNNSEEHKRFPLKIKQLTSLQTATENAVIFSQLSKYYNDVESLDAILATNMISVGLDVGRLALMIINGQPLTTAEYIQASSRVGRSEVPGIVFANYYRNQARSLSHYESFRPYHEAFYRFVEPTSVTPYTYQARQRALPAALVIVMRHGNISSLNKNPSFLFNDPSNTNLHQSVLSAIEQLKRRCGQSAPEQSDIISRHIDSLFSQWQDKVKRCEKGKRKLEYKVSARDDGRDSLLCEYNETHGLWAVLQSMRNVENNALLKEL